MSSVILPAAVDDGALQDEDGEYLDVLALEETVRGSG
jgi:hypothetical protein